MMLSVMVVGAGAAFSDQSKIKNTEAVDACTALNIIGGYPDGSFKPEGNITRAEVTKMICVALNGGKNPAVSTNTTPTFSDVRNNANAAWAEGYIESCAAQGIVSGVGGGKFAPNGNVTGVQLAKMLLVSLGYKSENEGFTGNAWATNVNVRAAQKGLYDGLEKMDTNAAITRDNAAQMVWNALNAYEVEYKTNLVAGSNGQLSTQITLQDKVVGSTNDRITLLEDKYEAKTFTGIFEGNDKTISSLDDGQIQVYGDNNASTPTKVQAKFASNLDLKYIGEEVSVLYKDNTNGNGTKYQPDSKDTIYGVFVTGETKVYNVTSGDLQDGDNAKIKFGDKEYKAKSTIKVIENYTGTGNDTNVSEFGKAGSTEGKYYGDYPTTIKFIEKDGEITTAYVNTYKLARVTAVNSTKVSINNGVGTVEFDGNNIYKDIKKDDIVVVQTFFNKDASNDDAYTTVTKAEVKSGKLDGYKGTEKVTFGGTTYTVVGGEFAPTSIDSDFEKSVADQIGETYDFYFIGNYVAAVKMTSDGTKNYAVVMGTTGEAGNKANPLKAAIMKANGTEATVELDTDGMTSVCQNDIIKYSEVNTSKIKVKSVVTPSQNNSKVYVKDTKTFDGIVTASDAPLFVKKGNDYYVYTIRNLNDVTAAGLAGKITDDGKVVAAFVSLTSAPSGASADTVYGIVSDAKGAVKIDGTYYTEFAVDTFNKKGEAATKKVLVESTSSALAKGNLVSFDIASNDIYSEGDITVYNASYKSGTVTAAATWVKEYDAKGEILTTWNSIGKVGSTYEGVAGDITVSAFDDDAVIAYIDADDDKGATDNGVPAFDGVKGYKNVLVVKDGDKIVGLFVDTDNNILEASSMTASTALTSMTVTGLTAPVKDAAPASSVTATNATVAVTWDPAVSNNKFAADTAYTAKVTVTPAIGYYVKDTITASDISVAGVAVSNVKNVKVAAKGTSVTFDVVFPKTNK
ncbi:S-layer homology domain-containing protein [Evtepia sp.]|uniref:S-layer homology domain-containing protein n=1 Tax=Evtepia sp. TaxID=2773933 RepID=UPI002E75F7EE|nr:S-layer homology domain-containing protein [Evtepia sp.]MEE0257833.1 S-layer homology domain-containing protein [Evtepia sp.]